MVDIEVWSYDPAKSAMLANAVASAYLAESKSSQATAARRATTDLSGRLKELQQRLRNAENVLAIYKAQNNFVGTQDTLISDQQLSAANQRLAAAHALTLDAQAKYDQIEASRRAATDPGAIPEALQSPTIANLRAQYAEARKKHAELAAELGPLHPAIKQAEKQVEDMRRTINEEVDRFAQSGKNDLTRARDYEASLNKALEAQKRQSIALSQASVRLRELERDVEASRDVYQSFLKRSRETEEQESLNTSAARIIGEATVPQRRTFPPAMSLLAILGFMLGALAASGWIVAVDRLPPGSAEPQPVEPKATPGAADRSSAEAPAAAARPTLAAVEKPLIARLQDFDVMRTLGGILASGGTADLTRARLADAARGLSDDDVPQCDARDARGRGPALARQRDAGHGRDRRWCRRRPQHRRAEHRAGRRARRRQGADDRCRSPPAGALEQGERPRQERAEPARLAVSIGSKASRAITTANGISILPAIKDGRRQGGDADPQGDRAGALRRRP